MEKVALELLASNAIVCVAGEALLAEERYAADRGMCPRIETASAARLVQPSGGPTSDAPFQKRF